MINARKISRRTVLRGLGTVMALPMLEAMAPAASPATRAGAAAFPNRMAFLYVPNGIHMSAWTPAEAGPLGKLPATLEPLAAVKDELLVLTGLAQENGKAKGDGAGDHARSLASFLTGTHPLKTDGANIRAGVSVDQVAARAVGKYTRFSSLELGIERGALSGNCDSGYSCAYSSNISWRSPTTPMAKEINPRLVFERLFADEVHGGPHLAKRRRYKQSILDFVAEDAGRLQARLGTTDRRKIDEYMTSVRELEIRVANAGKPIDLDLSAVERPTGIPDDHQEHIRLMLDLMVLAFQGDVTRIATFMYANEASNRSHPTIGVPEAHHQVSHHGNDPKKQAKIQKIDHFHVTQLAYFLTKLKAIPEGDGTLLDHSMIVYGSGIGDGNRHNHDDLPILMAGRGGGSFETGRHVKLGTQTPLNNLYLSMLEGMGVPVDSLGDSTGKLSKLSS